MIKKYNFNKKSFYKFIAVVFAAISVITVSILLLVSNSASLFPVSPSDDGNNADLPQEEIAGVPFRKEILPEEYLGRTNTKREIKYVVIHETANTNAGANANNNVSYLMNQAQREQLSWHYTVDDNEIIQTLPDDEMGYHAGDSRTTPGGNANGIGIEICVNSDGDYEKAVDNAAKLAAYLLKLHKLTIDDLKQHHDFSDKNCPMIMRDSEAWSNFCKMVEGYL